MPRRRKLSRRELLRHGATGAAVAGAAGLLAWSRPIVLSVTNASSTAGSPEPRDISHFDLLVSRDTKCKRNVWAIKYDLDDNEWGPHPTNENHSDHCLEPFNNWTQPPATFNFGAWNTVPDPNAPGYYLVTIPTGLYVCAAFAKCGQDCSPATRSGSTLRFGPCPK